MDSSTAWLLARTCASARGLAPENAKTTLPSKSRSRSESEVRAERIGPTRETASHWNTAINLVRPPSTVSSTTRSALSIPDCGRASDTLSILIARAVRPRRWCFFGGTPVSGQVATTGAVVWVGVGLGVSLGDGLAAGLEPPLHAPSTSTAARAAAHDAAREASGMRPRYSGPDRTPGCNADPAHQEQMSWSAVRGCCEPLWLTTRTCRAPW